MQTLYLSAALVGGALLLIQLVMSLAGGHADAGDLDTDAHVDASDGASSISFRTVVAFITFFGLGGMAATAASFGPTLSFVGAVLAGGLAFWLVGLAMLQLSRLRSSGNVDIQNAVGLQARVYLNVPAADRGTGAVTVPLQGRTVQYRAVSRGAELATGSHCRIVAVRGSDTLEVEPL